MTIEDAGEMGARDFQSTRSLTDCHFAEILAKNCAGMGWIENHVSPS
jgi:hypothetical protein